MTAPRGRGRPQKPVEERRLKLIPGRVNAAELAVIQAMAKTAGMPIGRFVREAVLKTQVVNRSDWQRRTYQLVKIGVNLNQMARWANTYAEKADAQAVIVALLRLERALHSEGDGHHDDHVE